MTNLEVADLLRNVAAAYQIKDETKNKFRIIAYQRAADAVEHLSSEIKDIWDEGKLDEIAGIGPSISEHLGELLKTGTSKHFERVLSGIPESVFEMMKVSGIGPKTALKLSKNLGIYDAKDAIKKLEKAIAEGKVSGMEGFGEQSQLEIKRSIAESKTRVQRLLFPYAENIADELVKWLKKEKTIQKAEPLGSLRRRASTVGDIDIAAAADDPAKAIQHFVEYPRKVRVLEKGEHSASIIVPPNIQIDLIVQSIESFGSLLQHFTGSKHHNVALREYALKHGKSLSEYGIRSVKTKALKKFKDEESFYNHLGLEYIPPELREDSGEIEAALAGQIPKMVELQDIKADLQIHSNFDIETSHDIGASSMEEIVETANSLSYEYLAFTEHNPSKSKHSEAQVVDILKRKREKVDKINYSVVKSMKNSVKKVFNSLEIDILPNGSIPVSDAGMATLDFALVSIHSSFRLSKAEMTKRVLSGLSHPKVKIFAHPTARKINEREGIELDWPKIFEFCIKNNKWLEINADPMRLDLPDFLVREGVRAGVKFTLGTDAHHKDSLVNMKFGVYVARRGWATNTDIINTRSLTEFEKLLK